MYKTYIDNTVFYKNKEYYAQGWITSENALIDSIFDIYDEHVSVVEVVDDEYYATGIDFDMASFMDSLILTIDHENHVEAEDEDIVIDDGLGELKWYEDEKYSRYPFSNGGDLEDDTHG